MSHYEELLADLETIDGFSEIGSMGKRAARVIRGLLFERNEWREACINHGRRADVYQKALNEIACWDDESANRVLEARGSYSAFDEPGAVQTAREALKGEVR